MSKMTLSRSERAIHSSERDLYGPDGPSIGLKVSI